MKRRSNNRIKVMVFSKTEEEGLKPITIEAAGGIDHIMKQIDNSAPILIDNNKVSKVSKVDKVIKKKSKVKTTTIRLNKLQFIFTYMTDDTLIDFLMSIDNNFTIYFTNGKRVDIEIIEIYRKIECDCTYCRKVVINEDIDILDSMSPKCYIEVKLDDEILNIIAEKQFQILEIMTDNIVQLPSSIPSYPTFLPPLPIIEALPPLLLATANLIDLTDY